MVEAPLRTLILTYFHMRRMVRIEVEMSVSVGGISVDVLASVVPTLITITSKKGIILTVFLE
jgi:hypothetical protein